MGSTAPEKRFYIAASKLPPGEIQRRIWKTVVNTVYSILFRLSILYTVFLLPFIYLLHEKIKGMPATRFDCFVSVFAKQSRYYASIIVKSAAASLLEQVTIMCPPQIFSQNRKRCGTACIFRPPVSSNPFGSAVLSTGPQTPWPPAGQLGCGVPAAEGPSASSHHTPGYKEVSDRKSTRLNSSH